MPTASCLSRPFAADSSGPGCAPGSRRLLARIYSVRLHATAAHLRCWIACASPPRLSLPCSLPAERLDLEDILSRCISRLWRYTSLCRSHVRLGAPITSWQQDTLPHSPIGGPVRVSCTHIGGGAPNLPPQ